MGNSSANPNAVSPDSLGYGNALYNQAFRVTLQPFPQFTSFNLYGLYPAGRYQRDAGFLRLEKRASFGLTLHRHVYSSPNSSTITRRLTATRISLTCGTIGPSPLPIRRDTLQVSYIYELPFGSDKPLLHFSGWRRPLVSGWSISGTAYWDDGRPLAMHPEFNNTGNVLSTLNVNVVPGVDPHVANPGPASLVQSGRLQPAGRFHGGERPAHRAEPDGAQLQFAWTSASTSACPFGGNAPSN